MADDGSGADALAADSIYTATLPASLQTNRRLIRYRISAEDTPGSGITVPYLDDPQPNFAYFVYDGTPDWSGAIRPGDSPVNHPGSLMSSIATYFLLSKNSWVDDSQFGGYGGSEYLWPGTMIYDGEVYDHIQYRPRGGVTGSSMGRTSGSSISRAATASRRATATGSATRPNGTSSTSPRSSSR